MDALRTALQHAFETGHPAQAYLIVGPVRGEARELAEWIGRQLLGDLPSLKDHAHPDMPWFAPEKKSRIIDVDMMRGRILPMAQQSALSGGWKIPVIVSADRMKAEAANAFLKTLEEPPPKTLFLLLADTLADMLPTIVSRCQMILAGGTRKLDEPWRTQLLDMLAGINEKTVLDDTLHAETIADILNAMSDRAEKEVKAESKKNTAVNEDEDTLNALIGARAKAWRNDMLLTLEQWMDDMIRIKTAGPDTVLNFPDCAEALRSRAGAYPLARLLENFAILETFAVQLDRNIKPEQILPYWMDRFYL